MAFYGIVEFKGTKEGIILQFIEHGELEDIKRDLRAKLDKSSTFFKGAEVIGTEGAMLEEHEKQHLKLFMEQEYGMTVRTLDPYVKKTFVKVENSEGGRLMASTGVFSGIEEGVTKFVRGTMRSGKSVEFEGNVVVLGDVNPGAEVVAYGNIIIMGTLRGVAHAGANGNEKAFVVANKLQPTQLRIARMITRAPDDSDGHPSCPEMAYIKEEMIVIEPYL